MATELIRTACPLDCWDCCSMIAHVEDGKLIKVEGNPDHPFTQGRLCIKGHKLVDRVYHPDRVLEPMKKVNGQWQTISWEQAFREIADKMRAAREQYGPTAVMHHYDYGSSGLLKALSHRFFNLFGGFTDTIGSLCWGAGLDAHRYDFGYGKAHHPEDLAAHTELWVIWGRNVSVTNMHMMPFIKKARKRGAELVVIDPLQTDLTPQATRHLQPRPGTDGALAIGLMCHLRDHGLVDETFVREHAVGYEEFAAYLANWTVERAAEVCEVDADDIRWLAERYADGPATTLLGLGMQRYANGGNTIRLINAVVAMSGNIGRPGGGVHYANQVHRFDFDALTRPDARIAYRAFTKVGQADEILAAQDTEEPIKVLFITCANPVGQVPDTNKLRKAYDSIDCIVVLDMFLHDSGVQADYFLPCTSVFEEEDLIYSSQWNPYLHYVNRAIQPRGNAKPDWQIFHGLAQELGFADEFGDDVHAWLDIALRPYAEFGIDRVKLQKAGFLTHHDEPVAWADFKFGTPSGKYEFVSSLAASEGKPAMPTYEEPEESPRRNRELADKYPYHLLTIHPRRSLNSQHFIVMQMPERPVVEISEHIAEKTGLKDGDLVRVYNDRGEVFGNIKVTYGQHRRTIKIEQGWWGSKGHAINSLTSNRFSDIGTGSAQYDCLVNLEKVSSS
jgi:anaerobic selenocysteine-containing dehydrogenase